MGKRNDLPSMVDGTKVIPKRDTRYQLENVQPGDNSRAVAIIMKFNSLPKVDLKNPENVRDRINEYFQMCIDNDFKPTVSSYAASLGFSRKTLWSVMNQQGVENRWFDIPTLTVDYMKRGYDSMEQLWEYYMLNGKINPVSGIFLGKNLWGYVDKTEHVVEPRATLDDSDLEKKYLSTSDSGDFSDFGDFD